MNNELLEKLFLIAKQHRKKIDSAVSPGRLFDSDASVTDADGQKRDSIELLFGNESTQKLIAHAVELTTKYDADSAKYFLYKVMLDRLLELNFIEANDPVTVQTPYRLTSQTREKFRPLLEKVLPNDAAIDAEVINSFLKGLELKFSIESVPFLTAISGKLNENSSVEEFKKFLALSRLPISNVQYENGELSFDLGEAPASFNRILQELIDVGITFSEENGKKHFIVSTAKLTPFISDLDAYIASVYLENKQEQKSHLMFTWLNDFKPPHLDALQQNVEDFKAQDFIQNCNEVIQKINILTKLDAPEKLTPLLEIIVAQKKTVEDAHSQTPKERAHILDTAKATIAHYAATLSGKPSVKDPWQEINLAIEEAAKRQLFSSNKQRTNLFALIQTAIYDAKVAATTTKTPEKLNTYKETLEALATAISWKNKNFFQNLTGDIASLVTSNDQRSDGSYPYNSILLRLANQVDGIPKDSLFLHMLRQPLGIFSEPPSQRQLLNQVDQLLQQATAAPSRSTTISNIQRATAISFIVAPPAVSNPPSTTVFYATKKDLCDNWINDSRSRKVLWGAAPEAGKKAGIIAALSARSHIIAAFNSKAQRHVKIIDDVVKSLSTREATLFDYEILQNAASNWLKISEKDKDATRTPAMVALLSFCAREIARITLPPEPAIKQANKATTEAILPEQETGVTEDTRVTLRS